MGAPDARGITPTSGPFMQAYGVAGLRRALIRGKSSQFGADHVALWAASGMALSPRCRAKKKISVQARGDGAFSLINAKNRRKPGKHQVVTVFLRDGCRRV
jgi:hypothetical protein